jgi:hypothetical protein
MLIDPNHPFFQVPWRRRATVIAPVAWGLVEVLTGNPGWGLMFLAAGGYAWYALYNKDPPGPG